MQGNRVLFAGRRLEAGSPTQSPSLDSRFRAGDGGRAENDRREGTNGSYATPRPAFFMRQFQDAIAPLEAYGPVMGSVG